MSWDIFVQDIPADAHAVRDIPDEYQPRPLGSRAEVIRRILEVVPGADFSDPSWGLAEGPGFSIEFNVGDEDDVRSLALHVRGGDVVRGTIDRASRS